MSESKLIPFDYQGHEVRTVTINGEPWFVAADILSILDISRSSVALLDEDEKGVHTMDTLGGPQEMSIVSESGLYSLTLGSKKPEAKPFKRWVTHHVIPAIRKTGTYSVRPMTPIQMLAAQAQAMAELEKRTNAALETSNRTSNKLSNALDILAAPTPVDWQSATKDKITHICRVNGLSYLNVYDQLYRELEHCTNTNLKARVRNKQARLKKAGGTNKEISTITELYIIAHVPALKAAFDGISRRFYAKYASDAPC